MNAAADIRLDTPQGQLAGLRWSVPGGPPAMCLHGWLDNAASFVPMARFLPELDLVAIDLPGHGLSAHRPTNAHYYFTDYLWDLEAALDALEWQSCHLIGHSLGAAVASIYSAAAPERVRSLVMLDSLGPMSAPAQGSTDRLRRSLRSVRSGPRASRRYGSIEDMIESRRAKTELSPEAARLLCERSARLQDGHYRWTNDPALYWVSPVLLTEDLVLEFLRHIESPVLSLTTTPFSPFVKEEKVRNRSAVIPHGRHELWQGGHHFHMDQPREVSETVRTFILEHDQITRTEP